MKKRIPVLRQWQRSQLMKRKFYGMFIDNAVLYYPLELAEQASAHEKCHPREKESVVSRISSRQTITDEQSLERAVFKFKPVTMTNQKTSAKSNEPIITPPTPQYKLLCSQDSQIAYCLPRRKKSKVLDKIIMTQIIPFLSPSINHWLELLPPNGLRKT